MLIVGNAMLHDSGVVSTSKLIVFTGRGRSQRSSISFDCCFSCHFLLLLTLLASITLSSLQILCYELGLFRSTELDTLKSLYNAS